MAAAAAAGGPGAPLSPDELLPKGDSEKTEEELEEEDDEEVLGPCGVGRGAKLRAGSDRLGGVSSACCGIRTKARRGARRGRGEVSPPGGGVRAPTGPRQGALAPGGGCRCFGQDPRRLHHS